MSEVLEKLKGGDLRSIGRSEEVVQDILENPALFKEVFEGMLHKDPRIRMRSADALEKVSREHPNYLQPFKSRLIDQISKIEQQEVRWHTAQMFSYLDLDETERDKVIEILFSYIDIDKSRIVKVSSMQTLADLAEKNEAVKPKILMKLKEIMNRGSPAMVNRGKKLIKKLTGK
jgi:hypothetical protein